MNKHTSEEIVLLFI